MIWHVSEDADFRNDLAVSEFASIKSFKNKEIKFKNLTFEKHRKRCIYW